MERINRRNFIRQGSLAGMSLTLLGNTQAKAENGETADQVSTPQIDSSTLSFGLATEDITPSVRLLNWVTGRPYDHVLDPIYLKTFILHDQADTVVIVSMELVYVGESITALLKDRISTELDIPRENILITATHNHSAPFSPVYSEVLRSTERDSSWGSLSKIPDEEIVPEYITWKKSLITQAMRAVKNAYQSREVCSVRIGKSDISTWVQNRRPRPVSVDTEKSSTPEGFYFKHPDWDPAVISGNMNFGSLDRTMNVLFFQNSDDHHLSTIFNLSAHAVSIYPYLDSISGDWPGMTAGLFRKEFGGESLFLQGTTGDINPWKRGTSAVSEMAEGLTDLARRSLLHSAQIEVGPIRCKSEFIGLPLTEYGRERSGLRSMEIEIQVITMGTIAIVALPGEPMTDIGLAVKMASPFPHTLVLGYSNGVGTQYIGMPGDKKYGGYEASEKRNLSTDMGGHYMVEVAKGLLNELYHDE